MRLPLQVPNRSPSPLLTGTWQVANKIPTGLATDPEQWPDIPPYNTMKRHDREFQKEKTRMGFCKIEGATRCLLNPIRDAGFEQHAGGGPRAAKLHRCLTSQKKPGAAHAVVRSSCIELTDAPAR